MELRPCPFCGSPARLRDASFGKGKKRVSWWDITCTNATMLPSGTWACGVYTNGKSPEEAAEKWNRRGDEAIPPKGGTTNDAAGPFVPTIVECGTETANTEGAP